MSQGAGMGADVVLVPIALCVQAFGLGLLFGLVLGALTVALVVVPQVWARAIARGHAQGAEDAQRAVLRGLFLEAQQTERERRHRAALAAWEQEGRA